MYLESGAGAECKDVGDRYACTLLAETGYCWLSSTARICAKTCELCSGTLRIDNSQKNDNNAA